MILHPKDHASGEFLWMHVIKMCHLQLFYYTHSTGKLVLMICMFSSEAQRRFQLSAKALQNGALTMPQIFFEFFIIKMSSVIFTMSSVSKDLCSATSFMPMSSLGLFFCGYCFLSLYYYMLPSVLSQSLPSVVLLISLPVSHLPPVWTKSGHCLTRANLDLWVTGAKLACALRKAFEWCFRSLEITITLNQVAVWLGLNWVIACRWRSSVSQQSVKFPTLSA